MKNSIIFIIALLLSACSTTQNSLYEEIGGKETLSNVFGLAVSRIYNDPTIGHYFKNVPKRHLRMHLTNQVCELIGGPCKYDGEKMETSHQGHNISDKEGKSFAFGCILSTSSYLLPRAFLDHVGSDLDALRYYDFLGHHDDVDRAGLSGACDAGGVM